MGRPGRALRHACETSTKSALHQGAGASNAASPRSAMLPSQLPPAAVASTPAARARSLDELRVSSLGAAESSGVMHHGLEPPWRAWMLDASSFLRVPPAARRRRSTVQYGAWKAATRWQTELCPRGHGERGGRSAGERDARPAPRLRPRRRQHRRPHRRQLRRPPLRLQQHLQKQRRSERRTRKCGRQPARLAQPTPSTSIRAAPPTSSAASSPPALPPAAPANEGSPLRHTTAPGPNGARYGL